MTVSTRPKNGMEMVHGHSMIVRQNTEFMNVCVIM